MLRPDRGGRRAASRWRRRPRSPASPSRVELLPASPTRTELPALLTDLVVDGYQLVEARAEGAGGVLLVAAAFEDEDEELEGLYRWAVDLGLDVILEVADEDEIERTLDLLDPDSFLSATAAPTATSTSSGRSRCSRRCRRARASSPGAASGTATRCAPWNGPAWTRW